MFLQSIIPNNTTYMYMHEPNEVNVLSGNASSYQVDSGPRKTLNVVRINEADAADVETRPACQRKNNIGFFKMHKCGSSTVQNILMRYGVRYDLDFVLPPSGNYLGQTYFNKQFVMPSPVHEFNILCHHTRFSKEGM